MSTQIQVRRGTAAQWTSANPTLASGEIGFETDTGKFKIGNGTAWTSLLYATDASDITGSTLSSNVTGSSLTSVGTLNTGTWNASVISNTKTTAVEDYAVSRLGISTSIELFSRLDADSTRAMGVGTVYLTGFVPVKSFSLNTVTVDVRTTGSGSLYALLCTTSSATPSIPTVVANTTAVTPSATGALSLSFASAQSLTAGSTYAIGFYSTNTATLAGKAMNSASHPLYQVPPYVAGNSSVTYATIANLPAGTTITQNTVTGPTAVAWARLS